MSSPGDSAGFCLLKRFLDEHGFVKTTRSQQVPDKVLLSAAAEGVDRDAIDRMVSPLLAMWLYSQRAISLGQATEWLDIDAGEFIRFLAEFGVPVVGYSAEELAAELAFIESITK